MQVIELTSEQRRVIEAGHDGPVPVVDPATHARGRDVVDSVSLIPLMHGH
jgi:hypothetical protein